MTYVFLATSAVVPSLLLMWYFHSRDVNREPGRALWTTFGLGVVVTVPIALVVAPVDSWLGGVADPFVYGLLAAFLAAAIPEEVFKFLVLERYAARHAAFDEPMDGMVYGVAASLGFATLENVLYVADGGLPVAILRALTAVPSHAFDGAIMGYFLARARLGGGGRGDVWKALLVPIVLHGLYDFPLLAGARAEGTAAEPVALWLLLLVPAVMIGQIRWTVRRVRGLRAAQLGAWAASIPPRPPTPAVAAPAVAPPPAAVPAPKAPTASAGRRLLGWTLALAGGAVASAGGLLTSGVAVAWLFEPPAAGEAASVLLGTVVIGIAPLLLGLWLFARGLRRIHGPSGPES